MPSLGQKLKMTFQEKLMSKMKKSPSLIRKFDQHNKSSESLTSMNRLSVPDAAAADIESDNEEFEVPTYRRRTSIAFENDPHLSFAWKDPVHYEAKKTLNDIDDIGQLRLHLIGCKGLYGADFGGKSDPYAIIHIGDIRFRSTCLKKTLNPEWNEEFVFPIHEISDIVIITVYDKDRFNDPELLGKFAIPVWKIDRLEQGTDHTFALKDGLLEKRAKGTHPQIVLGFDLVWNKVRIAVKTIRRKEELKPISFKRSLFISNVQRIRKALHVLGNIGKYFQSCFSWESPARSIKAFLFLEIFTYFFHPTFIPLLILAIIFGYPVLFSTDFICDWLDPYSELEHNYNDSDDEEDVKDEGKGDKKSLSERYKAVQEVTAFVQNSLGQLASTVERVKNVINFSVPYLSWLAVSFIAGIMILLFFIPVRYIVMVYILNKFGKKLIRPNHVPSSEILNFLSRVPDDPTLSKVQELSLFDQQLLREEEEERKRKENKDQTKLTKRMTAFFQKKDSFKGKKDNSSSSSKQASRDSLNKI